VDDNRVDGKKVDDNRVDGKKVDDNRVDGKKVNKLKGMNSPRGLK